MQSEHYRQPSTGVQYFLPKHTDVYLNALWLHAWSNAVATIDGISSLSARASMLVMGVRHKF
ncbi:hypothetical protein [Burkholderia territorii]|uniref:hypothetical protein n=1 Tax=Burkholderia territorii TaxID=1503055 RepID=UPI0012D991C1|nr:hypothetical protein [Burkholderia territorii]